MSDITELYEFNVDGVYYRFTPKLLKTTFNGADYNSAVITRSSIKLIDNVLKNNLTISFVFTNTFARLLMSISPENPVTITLYRNSLVYWQGTVLNVTGKGAFIDLECTSIYSKTTRPYAIRKVQILCPYRLYQYGCNVIKDTFSVPGTINNVDTSGTIVTMIGLTQPDNYFLDGEMKFNNQTRKIIKHTGQTLRLLYSFNSTPTGIVILAPGCDLTEATCASKFNNRINHGGFSRLPPITPYDNKGLL